MRTCVTMVMLAWFLLATGCGGEPNASSSSKPLLPGQQTYQRFCISCHASSVTGAPTIGNAQAWAPRIAQGEALMLKHTIEGMPSGGMPPRGMCAACSDQDLKDAIHYMTTQHP